MQHPDTLRLFSESILFQESPIEVPIKADRGLRGILFYPWVFQRIGVVPFYFITVVPFWIDIHTWQGLKGFLPKFLQGFFKDIESLIDLILANV